MQTGIAAYLRQGPRAGMMAGGAGGQAPAARPGGAQQGAEQQQVQQFSRKRRRWVRPVERRGWRRRHRSAWRAQPGCQRPPLPARRVGQHAASQLQQQQQQHEEAEPPPAGDGAAAAAAAKGARQLTQAYLDVGQRDFSCSRCPTCGLVYTKGLESEDKLHAAFHASATQGPRYHSCAGERLLAADGARGQVVALSGGQGGGHKVSAAGQARRPAAGGRGECRGCAAAACVAAGRVSLAAYHPSAPKGTPCTCPRCS